MDEWSKEFARMLDDLTEGMEQFFHEMAQVAQEAAETWESFAKFSEEVADNLQNAVFTEIDRGIEELFEPWLGASFDAEDFMIDPLPYPVEPTHDRQPACIGCSHYHGHVYGGNLLVCGMHPYGWDEATCPDWEGT